MAEAAFQLAAARLPDWRTVAYQVCASRALDLIEETELYPARKIMYQFSARGHELGQTLLAAQLTHRHDGVTLYYRSRPLLLALGVSLEAAAAGPLARIDSFSDGRDIGMVFNKPADGGVTVLPACGGVGSQYTPAAGWAQSIRYRHDVLRDTSFARAIAVVHGGDASTATNGFWSALNIATTLRLPLLFYIEDNGYGISVSSDLQTPGADIAQNLASFRNLRIISADGTEPRAAAESVAAAVAATRDWTGPVFLRLTVPRLSGHSGQDTQAYKPASLLETERARDPLPRLQSFLVPDYLAPAQWRELQAQANRDAREAVDAAIRRPTPEPREVTRFAFSETRADGGVDWQQQGGAHLELNLAALPASERARPEAVRVNMLSAIRRTLETELALNPHLAVFGEDVGAKGGVHAATLGLQEKFGRQRVFDTSLSEEGIIGRAVGMAIAGLMPVPEIQFRKYADPAVEQLNDCGTLRWRTANHFAAPMVVRMPGGFFKCGDPWHSQSNEVQWVHAVGWRLAMPCNAQDAVGLLRAAMRGNDPTIFFEHRAMLDSAWARRPYPGDDFVVPFGRAACLREGRALTVVSWGAMVERCEAAAAQTGIDVELLDLRTLMPWDKAAVLRSVAKTRRCLIVHEDILTAGFGAEIAARLAQEAFFDLDAPVTRLAMPAIPMPHSLVLLDAALPSTQSIGEKMRELAAF
jgi:2-oxoisovalerate dehydrogenase E1 component